MKRRAAEDTRPVPYRSVAECLGELAANHEAPAARHRVSFQWPTPALPRVRTETLPLPVAP